MIWIWLILVAVSFALGFVCGREASDIRHQRELMDAKRDKDYWCEIAARQRRPSGPPTWPPGSGE